MLGKLRTNKFEYKKLTEAEQKNRGILGRLVGVIADTKEPTRNGRKYSEQLWENVFNSPIMKEKIANRCCLGELNHPADRTDIDPEKVAVCLAEQPKLGQDGKLYGVFDILNTPNGKILKALCDYGCTVGISSRGQGDIITDMDGNEAVDPDTYDCECFDVVLVPGVESARLKYVTESLNKKTLKTTLTESLNKATSEERKIMEETLKTLNIDLSEAKKAKDKEENNEEESEEELEKRPLETETGIKLDFSDDDKDEDKEDSEEEENESEIPEEDESDLPSLDEEPSEDTEEESSELNMDDLKSELENSLEKDDEGNIKEDSDFNAGIKKALELLGSLNSTEPVENEVESTADEEPVEDIDDEEEANEDEEHVEEAVDNGTLTLVNNLKEALKAKSDLENGVKSLQERLAVSDAEVSKIQEECNRYKASISRLALLAKSNSELKESVSKLEESLNEKEELLKSQQMRISRLVKSRKDSLDKSNDLTESINSKDSKIRSLNENLNATKSNYESKIRTLTEKLQTTERETNSKIDSLNESLQKATAVKESYKKLATKAINKYIDIKAQILGLTSMDIKRKLGESYTMEDVDQVCEDLKAYSLNVSKLPIAVDRKINVKVNESARKNTLSNKQSFDDSDVDDTLMKLAGLY